MKIFIKIALSLSLLATSVLAQTITKLYVPAGGCGDPSHTAIQVFSIEAGKVIAEIQSSHDASLAVTNADSTEVWVFGASSTMCDVIDVATDKIIKTFDVERHVTDAAFTGDGRYCIVVDEEPGSGASGVIVIDRAVFSVAYSLPEVVGPTSVVVSRDSKAIYCASPTRNTVSKIDIPSFKVVKAIYSGLEPIDLALSSDGQYLFVACRGLDGGRRGGSQIAVIDTKTDDIFWILDNIGKSPASLALSPDSSRMVVTYGVTSAKDTENVRTFKLQVIGDSVSLTRSASFLVGQMPRKGLVTGSGHYWIGSDGAAGGVSIIDLSADTVITTQAALGQFRPLQAAAVAINIDQRIAALKAKMAAETDPAVIPDAYLDMAYLLKTADRKNDMVAAYQKVIDDYPQSFAAISSGLQLADICFADQLFSQTAEYSFNALEAYRSFLAESMSTHALSQHSLLTAVDRLAMFEQQFKKEYIKDVAESYLKLSTKSPELAEMFFRLGYHLRKQDEKKLANRCFTEVQNQIVDIEDPAIVQLLTARLQLITGDVKALYPIKSRKKEPVVDGRLTEWQKEKPLILSGSSGFEYGSAPWHGVSDLSGSISVVRTATDIFIAGKIIDDNLINIDESAGDMIAFTLDLRPNSGSYLTRDFAAGKGCFAFQVIAPTATNPKARLKLDVQTAFEIASAPTDSGYAFELKLPLSTFGSWLTKDTKRFGLGVELLDYDTPSDPKAAKAIGFLLPSEGIGGKPRPELFGVAEF